MKLFLSPTFDVFERDREKLFRASRTGRNETRRTKNEENRRYLVVARRVGKPTFRVFSSTRNPLRNERRKTKIGEGNGKRRRLDRRRDDDSASARRAGNRRAVVKRSPDVGAERFIVNLRKRVQ